MLAENIRGEEDWSLNAVVGEEGEGSCVVERGWRGRCRKLGSRRMGDGDKMELERVRIGFPDGRKKK